MKHLMQQLLTLVSSQDGASLSLESVDLVELCGRSAKVMRRMYKRDVEIHSEYKSIMFTADAMKLKQVLLILLDNALKYSTESVTISLSKGKDRVCIRVEDRGWGIPKEQLKDVFDRFYRVDRARHRKTGGTGLGLSIAQSIVRQHNGNITISSEENVGREVTVLLSYA